MSELERVREMVYAQLVTARIKLVAEELSLGGESVGVDWEGLRLIAHKAALGYINAAPENQ